MRTNLPQFGKGLIIIIAAAVVLAVLPALGVSQQWLVYIFVFAIYLAIANMWNLHCGYSGLITLCMPAFIGLGGYTLIMGSWFGLPIPLGIIAGAIVAALFALLISFPVFRLRGIYFAIGTLVVPEALKYVFLLWRPVVGHALAGGGAGYALKGAADFSLMQVYWFALVVGIGSILILWFVLRSRLGLGLAAIRDNDDTAASSGINVFRLKLYSFVIGAFVTGMAGAIWYIRQAHIEPLSAFNISWTMIAIIGAVIGGLRTEIGPIIGAIISTALLFILSRYGAISLLIQGAILVGIMLLIPKGIMGFIRNTRAYRSLLQLVTRR